MQIETERQEVYPIKEAEFAKYRNNENKTFEFVRLFRTSEYGYSIVIGNVYDKKSNIPGDIINQTITCEFRATASWIYKNSREICNACCYGEVITDIPFNYE